jgi:hypothetical protein
MSNRQYFEWLLDKTRCHYVNTDNYRSLLEYLFNYPFTWSIPFDSNRAENGIGLRYEFESECGFVGRTDDEPCSVLEVLIALARDWEHEITYDFHKGDRSAQWFWTMVGNLGLLEYPDSRFSPGIMDEIEEILEVWLTRKFSKSGMGSVFPVKNWYGDQRKVEIWMQLQNYVMENIEI